MRRKLSIVVAVLLALVILVQSENTYAMPKGDFIQDLIPNVDGQGINKEYNKYPLWNYTLDTDSSWFDPVTPALMSILNVALSIQFTIVRVSIMALEQAFTLDILGAVVEGISGFIDTYKKSTWDLFLTPLLVIVGLYVLVNATIAARRSKSVEQLLVTFTVISIAIVFFAYPKQILTQFNDISRDVSATVLAGPTGANSINQAVVTAGNQIWRQQVVGPWSLMQFGSIAEGKVNADKFLPYAKGSDTRDTQMEKQIDAGNWLMTQKGIYTRVILLFLTNTLNFVVAMLIVLLSILVLISQFVPLVLICLSPLVFAIALIPNFGLPIVYKWAERVLGAIFYKVVISIFFSIFIVATDVFTSMFGEYYLLQVFVQVLIVIVLVLERKRISSLVGGIAKGRNAVVDAVGMKSEYGKQIGSAVKAATSAVLAGIALTTTGGASSAAMALGKGSRLMRGAMAAKQFQEARQRKALHPMASQLLEHRFHEQKRQADTIAMQTGQAPRYSPFVNQVMDNHDRGLPLFTSGQQEHAIDELRDIQEQGGDPRRVFLPTSRSNPGMHTERSQYERRVMNRQQSFSASRENRISGFGVQALDVHHGMQRGDESLSVGPETMRGSGSSGFTDYVPRIDIENVPDPVEQHATYVPSVPNENYDPTSDLYLLADRALRKGDVDAFGEYMNRIEALEGNTVSEQRTEAIPSRTLPKNRTDATRTVVHAHAESAAAGDPSTDSSRSKGSGPSSPLTVQGEAAKTNVSAPSLHAAQGPSTGASSDRSSMNSATTASTSPTPSTASDAAEKSSVPAPTIHEVQVPSEGPESDWFGLDIAPPDVVTSAPPADAGTLGDWFNMNGGSAASKPASADLWGAGDVKVNIAPQAKKMAIPVVRQTVTAASAAPMEVRQVSIQSIQAEMSEANLTPLRYVSELESERREMHSAVKIVRQYNEQAAQPQAIIAPEIKVRAESWMQQGQSMAEVEANLQKRYESIESKLSLAKAHFDVTPKRYIEVPQSSMAQIERVEVRTPDQYFSEIFSKPVSSLNFDIKRVEPEFEQSVMNDWFKRSEFGTTANGYVDELYKDRQDKYLLMKTLRSGVAVDKEYSQQAKRAQAAYVDATKRYNVAKQLLGIDDGRKQARYKKDGVE